MERFLSSAVMNVDRKGRVSVPASFRSVLAASGETSIYTLLSLDEPVVDAGGEAWLNAQEALLDTLDPFSDRHMDESFVLHGDGAFLKLDENGRVVLTDAIRDHTGIREQVAFVGRRHFFQIWEPERFSDYRAQVHARVRAHRQQARAELAGKAAP